MITNTSEFTISELDKIISKNRDKNDFLLLLSCLENDSRLGVQKLLNREKGRLKKIRETQEHNIKMYEIEKKLLAKGFTNIAGVDEAGRGPLAGPVVVAAVVLDSFNINEYYNDSKKLSAKARNEIYEYIIKNASEVSISIRDSSQIDTDNILSATLSAMSESINRLETKVDIVLVDGNIKIPNIQLEQSLYQKGDERVRVIAAASIIAKVYRDKIMEEYDKKYPLYKFSKHKGYGTKEHIELIRKYGPCKIHRRSFLDNII